MNWVQRINPAWFLAGAAFFLPIKPAPVNLFLLLAFVTALFFKEIRLNLLMLLKHPVTLSAFGLVCFLFFTALYPSSDSQLAGDYATKYLRFAFIPFIAAILMSVKRPLHLLDWFSFGVLLSVVASYAVFFGWLKSDSPTYFKAYITHGFFTAIACYWVLYRIFFSPDLPLSSLSKFALGFVVLLCLLNLFVFIPGRTGWMTALLIPLLLGGRFLGVKKGLLIALGLFLIGVALFYTVEVVQVRTSEVIFDFQRWSAGDSTISETSLGQRILFLVISLEAIQQYPIFGHGLGGVVSAVKEGALSRQFYAFSNPHNQYLLLMLQGGLLALGLYFLMLLTILKSLKNHVVAWLCIIIYIINNLINSFHYDFAESIFFVILIGSVVAEVLKSAGLQKVPSPKRGI